MSLESYDTIGSNSDDEYVGNWSGYTERDESVVQNQYDAYTAKLEADIERWTTLAAQYEDPEMDILWPPKQGELCSYDKGIIMLNYEQYMEEGDTASAQELYDRHSWIATYLKPLPSQYEQALIGIQYKAASPETQAELHEEHPWLKRYLVQYEEDDLAARERFEKNKRKIEVFSPRKRANSTIW
jgi:hypothetical protein